MSVTNGVRRENCHSLHLPTLRFVAQRHGRAGVEEVARRAGEPRTVDVLLDTTQWCSWEDTRRLLEAAGELLGPDVIAEAVRCFEWDTLPEEADATVTALQALGGPAGILRAISGAASKFSSVIQMEPGEIGELDGTVVARSVPGFSRYRMLCEATAGLLAISSRLFGLPPATVVEERCEAWGDGECRFRVSWDPGADGRPHDDVELERMRVRFASLRSTVAELVSGHDADTVLQRIVERASRAARAPRHVLAVRLAEDATLRVHSVGFADDEAEVLAQELLSAAVGPMDSRLVVNVRSATRHYGVLAACNADGVAFLPEDGVSLSAFAELAAVALDSATALAHARRNAETAEALLDLARAVANVTSKRDVAARLAAAVPRVVGAMSAAVLLWDGERLVSAASNGLPEPLAADFGSYTAPLAANAPLRLAIAQGEPYLIAAEDADDRLRSILENSGTTAVAVAPILVDHQLFGIVTAGVCVDVHHLRRDADLVTRLRGLASFAATAFQNATLLEEVRHQSLHDHLTGTPNGRLLEDRVQQALVASRRSGRPVVVVFLDLDGFKAVNDTYGHSAGDDVLRVVAGRLRDAVREVDTVARLGGDEFVVLLTDVAGADAATKVVDGLLVALREPIAVGVAAVRLDASVGIAVTPKDGADFESLLEAADAAMYDVKRMRSRRQGGRRR